jgi:mercuric ion transport protein
MDNRKEQRLARAGMAASVAAAFGASLCCIGPIVAAMFGVTSLAALVKYEPLRPLFSAMTVVMLAAAFYMTYRKRPAEVCAPRSVCETQGVDRVQRINRVALWIASTLALIVLTFPTWSTWLLG